VLGEPFSLCDPYLFVVSSWLPRDGIDMARFPKIADHFARMNDRPAVKTVLARVAAGPPAP
jgi:glutathione S-transferase